MARKYVRWSIVMMLAWGRPVLCLRRGHYATHYRYINCTEFLPRDDARPVLARYMLWPCVCLCPSQVVVLLKRLNSASHKQHHTIAQGFLFSEGIPPGSLPTGAPNGDIADDLECPLTIPNHPIFCILHRHSYLRNGCT